MDEVIIFVWIFGTGEITIVGIVFSIFLAYCNGMSHGVSNFRLSFARAHLALGLILDGQGVWI